MILKIEKVEFPFLKLGYQCKISFSLEVSGEYQNPKTYPFSYKINLSSQSDYTKENQSKEQAFNSALNDFKATIRSFIFKYEPITLKFKRIEKNNKGKLNAVVFEKPNVFLNINNLDFIVLRKNDVIVDGNQFKILNKVGDCKYKGDVEGNEIYCKVSGKKDREAFEKLENTNDEYIGISIFN